MKLVLLPGLDGTGLLFKPLLESLPEDIETLVITYPSDHKLGYKALCDYVINRLPDTEDFVLLGESFSGAIAYEVAQYKISNLKSVIIVAGFLNPPRPILLGLSKILPMSIILSAYIPVFIIKSFLLGPNASVGLIDLFRRSLKSVYSDVLAFRLNQIANMNMRLHDLDIPALYIQASDDSLVPDNCVEMFQRVMKNIRVNVVSGPHFILQANPAACWDIIKDEIFTDFEQPGPGHD